MDSQLRLKVPIPILEEIIFLCTSSCKMTFRATCKRFLLFITIRFYPTLTTTLCGSIKGYEDGEFMHAKFDAPWCGVLNASSTHLFIADSDNHVIRKMDLSTHQVTTLCGTPWRSGWKDGTGNESRFCSPSGMALNEKENILYISDTFNHVIRSVNIMNGTVDTIVGNPEIRGNGDGIGKEAHFNYIRGLAFDSILNHLYVADCYNHSIRKVLLHEKRVETLCGTKEGYKDGPFEEALFDYPVDIAWNSETQELYVSDYYNHIIRILSLKNKTVKTLCGIPKVQRYENGDLTRATFAYPKGLGFDLQSQCLYVTDNNQVVRKISLLQKGKVDTFCGVQGRSGSKNGLISNFNNPKGIVVDSHSHSLYVMDSGNHRVRKIVNKTIL